jgi:hypothetical protein
VPDYIEFEWPDGTLAAWPDGTAMSWEPLYVCVLRGLSKVSTSISGSLRGAARTKVVFNIDLRGNSKATESYTLSTRGIAKVASPFTGALRGAAQCVQLFTLQARGIAKAPQWISAVLRGLGRSADDAMARYELFIGNGTEPDPTGTPDATTTALPLESPALDAAPAGTTREYTLLLRRRNRWNLSSLNRYSSAQNDTSSWRVTVDDTGAVVSVSPSAPTAIAAAAAAGGTVEVTAHYAYSADGTNAADTWLIYSTTDGTAPDPTTDTPDEVTINTGDGIAKLTWQSAALSNGTVVKALVRTRRSGSGGADSANTTIVSATVDTSAPSTPDGDIFFSDLAAQEQNT